MLFNLWSFMHYNKTRCGLALIQFITFLFQKNHQKSCSACNNKIEGRYYTVSGDIICDKCYKVDVFPFVRWKYFLKTSLSFISWKSDDYLMIFYRKNMEIKMEVSNVKHVEQMWKVRLSELLDLHSVQVVSYVLYVRKT